MSDLKTITIDVYPWACPTDDQKAMFDALPEADQLDMIRRAVESGFSSGVSEATVSDIIRNTKAHLHG